MSSSVPVVGQSNDLDRLIGLCDEISALARTGLPLEESLLVMGRDRRDRTGRKLRELAETLGTGRPLAEAIRNDPSFPPVFAAVVEAGIESGNLSGALDSIVESVRSLRETRLFLLRSTLYPLISFTTLWLVFSVLILALVPKYIDLFGSFGRRFALLDGIDYILADTARTLVFAFGVPVLLWGAYLLWGFFSARSNVIQSAGSSLVFRLLPWVGPASVELQKAGFARILSMLIRSSVPLDKAIPMAARACSDRYGKKENLEALRERIVRGEKRSHSKSPLAPLIEWSLGIPNQKRLLEGIDRYAGIAHARADLLLTKCEMILPAFLALLLALSIGICYFLVIVWPYIHSLKILAGPDR